MASNIEKKSVKVAPKKGKKTAYARRKAGVDNALLHITARTAAADLLSLMIRHEAKDPVPKFRGLDAPTCLADPFSGYIPVDTKESASLRNTISMFFSDREYAFKLKTVLNMSSSGVGTVNSVIAMSACSTTSEFVSLAALFSEFFITSCDVTWEPVSMFNYPLTGTAATTVSSLPMGCSDLQHGQPAYTSMTSMSNNYRFAYHNSGRPFHYSWVNTEKPSSTVLPTQTAPTQAWALTSNGLAYTGTLQFLSQAAPPALPATQVLGTFAVNWNVLFRVRQ